MSRINLNDVKAKLKHLQGRNELHGDKAALAMDMRLVIDVSNEKLDMLDRRLNGFLYWHDPKASPQTDIEGDRKTNLRFPHLRGPLKWAEEYEHCVVKLIVNTSAEIHLQDVSIDTISVNAKEGGTVSLELRVQTLIDSEVLANLFDALGREIPVSIDTSPIGEEQLVVPEAKTEKAKRPHTKKKADVVAIKAAMEANGKGGIAHPGDDL